MANFLKLPNSKCRRSTFGLSLIELMVGLLIGMIGSLVIFQVLVNADGRRRTTVSASDAQVTGNVGLFSIDRDLKQGAFNFGRGAWSFLGCNVRGYDANRGADPNFAGPAFNFPFAPVLISPAAGGRSQAIDVLIGSSPVLTEPIAFSGTSATSKTLQSRAGFTAGDFLMVQQTNVDPNQQCALVRMSGNPAPTVDFQRIDHEPTGDDPVTHQPFSRFNASPPLVTFASTGTAVNLGRVPRLARYYIETGRLFVENRIGETTSRVGVADGMVDLQAQYGVDTNNNGSLEAAEWTTVTPATSAAWQQLRAVRVGLLVRSGQYERPENATAVTTSEPEWAGGKFVLAHLDGSTATPTDPALDWHNYRYRVYQTTVMLRNMVWGK